ncbi:MAG TPA: hypothetical protein VE077_20305 [Candidatus Methylomirabilis sp.]|nr:hypothetical protein [Candidatus Methylomirabilis sp.]
MRRKTSWLCALLLAASCFFAASAVRSRQAATAPPSTAKPAVNNTEFAAAADEVLQEVSQITGLKQLTPLKKTLRSRDEIRAYVIREMNDEKNPKERYAEARSAEAFGLIPKGFDLDDFMVDLLTEQIAGLYDPKAGEFYIADWIPVDDQRMVMAHELTHALQDQHFKIDAWTKAARPNDDAELARESVLEGSAMAAMIDYLFKDSGHKVEDFGAIDPSLFAGDLSKTPKMEAAPPFIRDALIFPYFGGLTFSAAILHSGGWGGLSVVFAKPPFSTQQIMHPALYKSGKAPADVKLPALEKLLGADWVKLDENLMGEFGWKEILKQFLGEEKAKPVAAAWEGDRYAVFEETKSKKLFLAARLKLDTEEHAGAFFAQYSAALQKKYPEQTNPLRLPSFLSFETPDGGIYLRCVGLECLTVEGATRRLFDGINEAVGWPAAPVAAPQPTSEKTRLCRTFPPIFIKRV